MKDSRSVNHALWEDRAAAHAASPDYGFARFSEDPAHLSRLIERPWRVPMTYTLQAVKKA